MKRFLFEKRSGFTLIELMIVVVIIGVLSALAIPRFSEAARKAKYTQARLYLKYFFQSLSIFYTEKGCYPTEVLPNIPPFGLVPQYADEWPGPDRDPMNSLFDYEQWPATAGNWIGVIYLGPNLIHDGGSGSSTFYASNGKPGQILEFGDDIYIVISTEGRVCP
ncbi:prepilin-type N-terminal cleavage/methylation domain-containing protein [bacterium]|nr:prepilin-type N-terminal cleavage/methylation domain-containing protein [bacterium]